jgi:hypothetical protein
LWTATTPRQLAAESFARCAIFVGGALAFDVAALCRGLIKNVVGGLDQSRRLQLAQEIAGADQTNTLINDGAAALDVGALEQQQRLGCRIAAQEPLQRLDRGLFAEAADRTTFLEAPLLSMPMSVGTIRT